jgi:hypothetical protein
MSFMGLTADAFFDSFDPISCVDTSAFITATNGINKLNNVTGRPQPSSAAFVEISQFNLCNGTSLFDAVGQFPLAAGAFQIDRRLNSATLNTSADLFDNVSENTVSAQISIVWAGTGGTPTAFRGTFMQRGGGLRVSDFTFATTSFPATASGSVIEGGTNFASGASVFADLASMKNGNVTVCIGPCL